jgi:DNA polymerase-3 subunit delta'
MKDLILHPNTASKIKAITAAPPHALLIAGPAGIGKTSIALDLAEAILDIESFKDYPYGLIVNGGSDKANTIESIRTLQSFLSLKVLRNHPINRIVIVEEIETFRAEAQNALLKTIEEPPEGSMIILTCADPEAVLSTIRSRVRLFNIQKPSKENLEEALDSKDVDNFNLFYSISNGLPGLLVSLISNEGSSLLDATTTARNILSSSTYERLNQINGLAKDKQQISECLDIMQQMAETALVSANSESTASRWKKVLGSSYEAKQALKQNVQPKLVLINLMLSL